MKPGVKTTELWLTIVVGFLLNVGAIPVPEKYQWVSTVALVAAYAISRGLAKYETPSSPAPIFGADLPAVDPLDKELAEQRALTPKDAG